MSKKNIRNPIIDNRIISDKTFATRLLSFVQSVYPHDWASEEEQDYLFEVAKSLREYQIATCTDEEEIAYFKNLGITINNNG